MELGQKYFFTLFDTGCQVHGSVQNIGIQEFQDEKYRSFTGNKRKNIGELQEEWMDVNTQMRAKQTRANSNTTSAAGRVIGDRVENH